MEKLFVYFSDRKKTLFVFFYSNRKNSGDKDDVLSLDSEEGSGEFSGFSPLSTPQPSTSNAKGEKTVKSKVVKVTKKKRNNKKK